MPSLSPDSPGMEGEIALLRSLTNRLLSKRPIDHVQISRYLRILARSLPANSQMPRELTDEEQIDSLIKKVLQDNVDKGKLQFRDLVPVRMARPGDKWWPWRHLLPLQNRWRYGLIDPDEPWPQEENERLAEGEALDRLIAESYLNPDYLEDLDLDEDDSYPDEDPPDDSDIFTDGLDDPDPSPSDPYNECPNDEEGPPPYGETQPTLTVIPAEVEDVVDASGRAPWSAGPRSAEAEIYPREESRLPSKTPQPENPPQQNAPSRASIPHDDPTPASPTPRRTARGRARPP